MRTYSVNVNGKGHDGSSGKTIPARHADYLRGQGYKVPLNLTLESIDFENFAPGTFEPCVLDDDLLLG